jgi:RNA polymerase sigma-70 factor (ECF subfamily)
MSESQEKQPSAAAERRWFTTTHWSVVLSARNRKSPQSQGALAALCETYWFPLYGYVRRSGYAFHDAQDLTQEFFAWLLEKDFLKDVDRERGKFRSFLLAALKHFLSHQRERARAKKRGGGRVPFSLDFADAEHRYRLEPENPCTPERLYQRRWALTLLERVIGRLEGEQVQAGKGELFAGLKEFLAAGREPRPYRGVAEQLGMTEGAVKVAVHRLRRRYRGLLKEEIARTVADPGEIESELCELCAAFAPQENSLGL